MATASILYVGDDTSFRIPVLKRTHAIVRQCLCCPDVLRDALANNEPFSALTFEQNNNPIPRAVLTVARSSSAPLILFENTNTLYDASCFDLIIPALTPPDTWLESIRSTIARTRRLCEASSELRKDVASVRAAAREQRARMHRLLPNPIDLDAIWRIDWNTGNSNAFSPDHDDPTRKP